MQRRHIGCHMDTLRVLVGVSFRARPKTVLTRIENTKIPHRQMQMFQPHPGDQSRYSPPITSQWAECNSLGLMQSRQYGHLSGPSG